MRVLRYGLAVAVVMAALWAGLAGWLPGLRGGDRVPSRVPAGVHVGPVAVGGWSRDRLRAWLEDLAREVKMPPVDARSDPANRAVIPGHAGQELDVEASLDAILRASPGSHVPLRFRVIPPKTTLDAFPGAPIYHGNRRKRAVTFLVNVAWGEEHLKAMLDRLDQAGVRVTFFPVGRWAEEEPDWVLEIARRGHELGNHGYSDALALEGAGRAAVLADLRRGAEAVARAAGVPASRIRFYSTHRGVRTPAIEQAAAEAGVRLIFWSLDTVDWQKPPPAVMARRIVTGARPGDLILMHPTAPTVEALPAMIRGLQRRGFAILPLGELLSAEPTPDPAPAVREAQPVLAGPGTPGV